MKAITLYEPGPPDHLKIEERPDPVPMQDEVVVRVSYAGVNHGDAIRRKRSQFFEGVPLPVILGFEGVGIVQSLGEGVTTLSEGDRVAFLQVGGSYSQLVSVRATQAFKVPPEISDVAMAASVCTGTTAWHLLRLASPKNGQALLVHGAAGGVGSMLVQMCRSLDVRVIATVGSAAKAEYVRSLGVDKVIDYSQVSFASAVHEVTNSEGVDLIFDCVGKAVTDGNFNCLKRGGSLYYYGSASGHPEFPGDKVLMNEFQIKGFVIFGTFSTPEIWSAGVEGVLQQLLNETIIVRPKVIAMENASDAHYLLDERNVQGKIVLDLR